MIGSSVGGYRLLSELGSGGMGSVWLGEAADGRRVALKVVHPHLAAAPGFERRFLREAELGSAIRHENVVATLASGRDAGPGGPLLYLAMEYVDGQTLRSLLEEMGRVPEELCRHIGREIAKGLAAIHASGIVHRDLKPENVLITPAHVVKVMDLGMARRDLVSDRISEAGAFAGTVLYAAPEQFVEGTVDGRADLYALGLILHELASGAHPFAGGDLASVMHRQMSEQPPPLEECSDLFESVVATLLRKRPEERFASAAQLLEALEGGERSAWFRARSSVLRARPLQVPRESAVVGREPELSRMAELFADAVEGRGRFLLVEGEAGIGKSRLVDEFARRMRGEGARFDLLYGAFPPAGGATAAAPFRAAFGERLLHRETLVRCLAATPSLLPAFEALLRGEPPPPGSTPLTGEALPAVLVHSARELARTRTTVLVVEDLHFAPPEGLALVTALALAAPGHRLMVVATGRPEAFDGRLSEVERLGHAARIRLGRLDSAGVESLLRAALGSDRLAADLAPKVTVKSDGNPFFVVEIVRELREKGFAGSIPIPSSVLDLVRARIDSLADEDRELLELAACAGFEFDPHLVAEAARLEPIPALKQLGRVERRHRLLRSRGSVFAFDHHQVREVLYDGLPDPLRAEYHRLIGEALLRRGGTPAEICRHLFRGGEGEAALPRVDAAIAELEAQYANDEAIDLGRRALALPLTETRRAGLLLRLSKFYDRAGRREEQRALLWEAMALAERTGERELRCRCRGMLGAFLVELGRYGEAERELLAALDLGPSDATRMLICSSLGTVGDALGRFEQAREYAERFRDLARKVGDLASEARARGNLGNALRRLGRYDEARELFESQMEAARALSDRFVEAQACGNLGNLLADQGRTDEAQSLHERQALLARDVGYRRGEARARGSLAINFKSLGRYADAVRQYEWYVALSREILSDQGVAYGSANHARLRVLLGDAAGARTLLETARPLLERMGSPLARAYVALVRAELAEIEGDPALSEAYREAARQARAARDGNVEAAALLAIARLGPDPVPLAAEAFACATQDGERVIALALQPARAAEAHAMLQSGGPRIQVRDRMQALWHLGDRAQAKRILESLREHAPEEWRDAMVERVPLHREIWSG